MPYSLAYKDRYKRVIESLITSDTSDSIAFASIPDEVPTKLVAEWTGKQYTKLLSALYTGANLMFPEEANEIIWQLIKVVHQPIPLDDEDDGGCINYLPSAPFVSYDPQDPYAQPDVVPDGYLVPPFHYNSDFLYPEIFGFLATDVMVPTDAIPIFGDWGDVLGLHFPTIKLTVFGEGQIELDLLSIQLGGYAIVKVGEPPNIFDIADGIIETGVSIIDLQADVESIPIESDLVIEHEVPINAPDGTNVYIVFVPKISASLDFFGMGGGIRQIGLCGLEMSGEAGYVEDVRFNTENCTFEKRIGGEWEAIVGGNEWLECVEALLATQAEITDAVVDAAEIISSRFLSGIAGNVEGGITINPDGTIEVSTDGVPADDPDTVGYDERAAAIMGGAVSVARAFELFLDKLDAYYGATNGTPVSTEASAQFGIKAYFPCDPAEMDTAISIYYSYRATNPRILFNTSAAFERYLYCNGANEQGIARWLIDQSGYSEQKNTIVYGLLIGLAEEFFTSYYGAGVLVPSTDYIQSPCHKNDVEEWTQDWSTANSFSYSFAQTWKDKHRFLLEIEGSYADADEPNVIHDGLWKINTSTGVKTFVGFSLVVSGTTNVTALQAPYRDDHKYAVTIEKTGDNIGSWSVGNDTADLPNVVGSTTFRFTDLGVII